MSRLNANAFSFVPGHAFRPPPQSQQPQQPASQAPSAPVERAPQAEAPAPPRTISLNIGRPSQTEVPIPPPTISLNISDSKSAALPPAQAQAPAPSVQRKPAAAPPSAESAPSLGTSSPAPTAAPSSKTFTLEKSKNDTAAIAQELRDVADEQTLQDLYGNGKQYPISIAENVFLDDFIMHCLCTVKEHLNIVFIGHVDAGKSTMGGNLLFLTGMVDKRTMEKYEREAKEAGSASWYLSWALDSTPQERAEGKTVEVGRGYFETNSRRYTILDAPGHKTFVPSMISGAAQADVAILVISARKGEFETGFERGGQTREHIMLVKTLGVARLICVINKMDEPTVQWQQSRFSEIRDKLTPFIKGAGFSVKKDVTFIPVSAYTGANLKDRVDKAVCPWYE